MFSIPCRADTNYVSLAGGNTSPYTNWATAANEIQDCIDDGAVIAGDIVMVSNGWYSTGGRTDGSTGVLTNRVVVDKDIMLISLSGPEVTHIEGLSGSGSYGCGSNAMRCVALLDGKLSGFTLTNGHTAEYFDTIGWARDGGGVFCGSGGDYVTNCVFRNNVAFYGGGISYYGTAYNCQFYHNTAYPGGSGGNVYNTKLYSCILVDGYARYGTVYGSAVYNSLIYDNTCQNSGGAQAASLYNCTVVDNSMTDTRNEMYAGGLTACNVSNSIVYYNSAAGIDCTSNNYVGGNFEYSCTVGEFGEAPPGTGNITNEPDFWSYSGDDFRLNTNSPCVDAGVDMSAMYTDDLIGTVRPQDGDGVGGAQYDIGCYEYVYDTIYWTNHYVVTNNPGAASPYTNWAEAAENIQDAIDVSGNKDWVVVSNGWYDKGMRTHANTGVLTNRVVIDENVWVKSVNGPEYTFITGKPHEPNGEEYYDLGSNAIRCVALLDGILDGFTLTNGHTCSYYTTVAQAQSGGGVYVNGGDYVTNCIFRNCTAFYGAGLAYYGAAYNCRFYDNTAWPGGGGGGVRGTDPYNCIFKNNYGGYGGAVRDCTAYNCLMDDNTGSYHGGGAYLCGTLYNCTIVNNQGWDTRTVSFAGGVYYAHLTNCIVYYNSMSQGLSTSNNYNLGSYNVGYTCTIGEFSEAPSGPGNDTNPPAFVNYAADNFRLKFGAPQIDAGMDVGIGYDLEGNVRPYDGDFNGSAVYDMGCYEYVSPTVGTLIRIR